MSENEHSTTTSHIILASTSIYCLLRYTKYTENHYQLPIVTFSVIILHSLFGVWESEIPDSGHTVDSGFYYTLYVRDAFALSSIAGQMCIKARSELILGYAHVVMSTVLLFLWIMGRELITNLANTLSNSNIISCIIYSYLDNRNWWGVGAAIFYSMARASDFGKQHVDSESFENWALVFFTYFAFRACERESETEIDWS